MKKRIDITAELIKGGESNSTTTCPTALGIKEVVKPGTHVNVNRLSITLDHEYKIPVPDSVNEFIKLIDNPNTRDQAKPFTFYLDIPDKYLKKGSRKKAAKPTEIDYSNLTENEIFVIQGALDQRKQQIKEEKKAAICDGAYKRVAIEPGDLADDRITYYRINKKWYKKRESLKEVSLVSEMADLTYENMVISGSMVPIKGT